MSEPEGEPPSAPPPPPPPPPPLPPPSVPPPDPSQALRNAPNPERPRTVIQDFLQSSEGQNIVKEAVQRGLHLHMESAFREIKRVRESEQVELERFLNRSAENAARATALKLQGLVESVASAEVRKEAEKAVPSVVREDALMKRILEDLRRQVRVAASKELAEICNEERYQRVNHAFLKALEGRVETMITRADGQIGQKLREADAKVSEQMEKGQRPARIGQILGGVALLVAFAAHLPKSRL